MHTVQNVPFNPEYTTGYGAQQTDDRYKSSSLKAVGPAFYTFKEDSSIGPHTMGYEENQFIIEGEMTLTVGQDGDTYTVVGKAGDLLAIEKGSTVSYSAPKGTRTLVVISPVNWEEHLDSEVK